MYLGMLRCVFAGCLLQSGPVPWLLCPKDQTQGDQGHSETSECSCSFVVVPDLPQALCWLIHDVLFGFQEWARATGSETRALCVHGMKLAMRSTSSRYIGGQGFRIDHRNVFFDLAFNY